MYTQKKTDELRAWFREFVLYGGYPRIVLAGGVERKEKYLQQIIDTYVKKDIRDLVYCLSNGFTTGHLLDDIFRFLRPNKRLGVLVVEPDVLFDGGYQFRHAFEYSPTDSFPCDFSKPTFYQIQPG